MELTANQTVFDRLKLRQNVVKSEHKSTWATHHADAGHTYIETLDGWRAIAIVGVLVFHATHFFFSTAGPFPSYYGWLITTHGAKGVDIFFALSGFLICTRLLEEHRQSGRVSIKGFYIRRTFRILPPYLCYLAVLGALSVSGFVIIENRVWLSCLAFLRNYTSASSPSGWYTAHFWSLSVEEHFYLLWPGLLVVFGIRRCRWLAPAFAVAVATWRAIAMHWLGHAVYSRTDTRLDSLLWGCCLALMLDVPHVKTWMVRWLSMATWGFVLGSLLLIARYQLVTLESTLSPILYPLLIAGTVLRPNSIISTLLECSLLRWLGRLSYSLYLWQQLFMIGSYKVERPYPFGNWQQLPWNILAVFGFAIASYYLIERPTMRLGRRFSSSWTLNAGTADVVETPDNKKPQFGNI